MSEQGSDPAAPTPSSSPAPPARSKDDIPWKLIAFGALALYAILIVLLNRRQVDVSFVFFTTEISLLVLIILCVGIGFAAGYMFEGIRARRRRRD